jgi:hypothetical protein
MTSTPPWGRTNRTVEFLNHAHGGGDPAVTAPARHRTGKSTGSAPRAAPSRPPRAGQHASQNRVRRPQLRVNLGRCPACPACPAVLPPERRVLGTYAAQAGYRGTTVGSSAPSVFSNSRVISPRLVSTSDPPQRAPMQRPRGRPCRGTNEQRRQCPSGWKPRGKRGRRGRTGDTGHIYAYRTPPRLPRPTRVASRKRGRGAGTRGTRH